MHVLIVCNGFPPSLQMLKNEILDADLIIGADGGGNVLLAYQITPHLVIGDMDSFRKPFGSDIKIIYDPDQETNDLEKALNYAVKQKAETCTVLGAFGKRLDHSMKNLSVMMQFHPQFEALHFKDEYQKVFLVDSFFEAHVKPGTIVSLFPLTGIASGITTKGLKYALHDEALRNGMRDGTSNVTTDEYFSVEVKEGALVIFIELESEDMW